MDTFFCCFLQCEVRSERAPSAPSSFVQPEHSTHCCVYQEHCAFLRNPPLACNETGTASNGERPGKTNHPLTKGAPPTCRIASCQHHERRVNLHFEYFPR